MVALVIFTFVIAAATAMFVPLVNQFKQQSKIAETNIEGIVGLDMLRGDLEQAGYGLPWYFPDDTINYSEATVAPANAVTFNDSPGNPPRAVVAADNVTFGGAVNGNANVTGVVTGSDYLAIKSIAITGSATAQKWTYILAENEPNPRKWNSASNDLKPATDRVIVIRPKVGDVRLRELVMDGSNFFTKYSETAFPGNFSPTQPSESFLIYGVDPSNDLKTPFNRADYYLGVPTALPRRCAVGTGILYKAVLSQADGSFPAVNTTQLLDCVADMQVVFGLDMNYDGIIGTYSNADGSTAVDAGGITGQNEGMTSSVLQLFNSHPDLTDYRNSLQEVRIYILAHEGQMDPNYTYSNPSILVGELGLGRTFNFAASGIANWQNYRWKLYTLVVKLQNTR